MVARILALAVAASLAVVPVATPAIGGKDDYAFEPVTVDVRNGKDSELAVRLIHKPTGKAVEGAIIFRTRLDMSPDSMGEMTAKHAARASNAPDVYSFRADLPMAGNWAFKLMAKVSGERETIEGAVVFNVR